jgi:hypothetical protein
MHGRRCATPTWYTKEHFETSKKQFIGKLIPRIGAVMFKLKINIVSSFRSLRRGQVVGEVDGGNAIVLNWEYHTENCIRDAAEEGWI